MIKIAIVDNEAFWQKECEGVLSHYALQKDLDYSVSVFDKAESFLEDKQQFEIVFMDIEMDNMSGLEAAKIYKKRCPDGIVMLVTTHDELSTEGYKVSAFRYIRKGKLELEMREGLDAALECLKPAEKISIVIVNKGKLEIAWKEIVFLETEKRNVWVHTTTGSYLTNKNITEMRQELEKYDFIYPHKSFLVNLNWIDKMPDKHNILLKTGQLVPVSQKKVKEIWLLVYQWKLDHAGK